MAKIEYEQEHILMAVKMLNEITVTGLRNAEKLVIVSKLLDGGKVIADQNEGAEVKEDMGKEIKEAAEHGKR